MSTVAKTARWMAGAGAIACCVQFTPIWEGMDSVAKRDMIGTGHPITYCNGLTSVDGKVKVGQHFTKAECDKALAEALPKYWAAIEPHIQIPLPDKTAGSLLDASFNAGPGAVIKSPMLAKMNAGDLVGGCNAFAGWYVRSDGKVRAGLQDRRNGEDHGDKRLSEKGLCLQGVREGVTTETGKFDFAAKLINSRLPEAKPAEELTPEVAPPAKIQIHKQHMLKPHVVVCTGFLFTQECK